MDFIIQVPKAVPGSTDLSVSTDRKSTDLASKGHRFRIPNRDLAFCMTVSPAADYALSLMLTNKLPVPRNKIQVENTCNYCKINLKSC